MGFTSAGVYQIRVKGLLDAQWADWFEGLRLEQIPGEQCETVLTGPMADQAALHGTLMKVRDMGLTLLGVTRVEEMSAPAAASGADGKAADQTADSTAAYATLESRVVAWARTQPELAGIVAVGSRARAAPPPDRWSDLDLVLWADDPARYAADSGWLARFGEAWLSDLSHTGRGDAEWLMVYVDGLKLDVVLSHVPEGAVTLNDLARLAHYQSVFSRGVRGVYARSGDLHLAAPVAPPYAPPGAEEFNACLQRAWLAALRAAKCLARRELWAANMLVDGELKEHLLALLEWHARAKYGPGRDVWPAGRFLSQWADPGAAAELPATFGRCAAEDLWRALRESLNMLEHLARETADRLGYVYPVRGADRLHARLNAIQAGLS